jgi:hypothetical protein
MIDPAILAAALRAVAACDAPRIDDARAAAGS